MPYYHYVLDFQVSSVDLTFEPSVVLYDHTSKTIDTVVDIDAKDAAKARDSSHISLPNTVLIDSYNQQVCKDYGNNILILKCYVFQLSFVSLDKR